ncbi:hypothetical protein AB0E08_08965 [Streptomyces sp. NPDC048281]|uniref:hypothetical protein n=1 Tax=Streptomyces sp. NPDC048281 TaxID=3154715 RepID=UPI003420A365
MILPATAPAPSAPLLPEPDTLVLLNRPLRPGTDPSTLSVFADQRWRLSPAVFEGHTTAFSIDFSPITAPFLHTVKTITWLLLNHTSVGVSTLYFRPRTLAITTITSTFRNLRLFTDWLHGRGRTCFGEVLLADLDDYAAHVKATETSHAQREDRLSIVNRVWSYRDLLPEADRLPQTPPWRGERIQDILQQRRAVREENRTPRIHPETMSALLAWSLRFVETFAEDITAAFGEHLVLSERSGRSRRGRDIPSPRRPKGALTDELRVLLSDYRERGRPLPGIRDNDGTLRVNLSHIAKVLDTVRGALNAPSNSAVFAEMGLPVIEGAPLDTPVTGQLDGQPWHDGAIDYSDAGFLVRHLSTACFIVISYLSGMRSGEVLSLERGCVERDHAHGLVLLRGRHWKGVRDAAGDKMPEGEIRADPWVVTEAVAAAVAVLERLHTSTWLFPATLFTDGRDGATILRSRVGGSRSETRINHDIAEFLAWVETYCTEHGRSDHIPPDPVHPVIYSARLRRTLAWFIVRRPRGLVAAAIQYGHLRVQMTLGYAGNYASGFPDDLAFEDWLARLDTLADAHQRLREGEQVSGPAAEAYRHRVQAATRFAGRVLRTKRHANTMLANPDLQIFPGKGMTCVLDPKRAACRLRSEEDSTRRTPDLDECRPNCVNIARTDRDIEHVLVQIERLRPLIDDPLAPAFRHAREQHELDRLERIVTAHDSTGEPHDGH